MINEMRGRLHHAAGSAGRAHAPTLAGIGDDKVVAAVSTAGAGEAVGQYAAFEVAAEFAFDECWRAPPRRVVVEFQPGRQMALHGSVEQRALGLPAAIGGSSGRYAGGGGGAFLNRA